MWYMVKDKDIDIQYIHIEDNPADIMKDNTLEEEFLRHMKIIIEGELWDLVDTERENVKNTKVMDDFTTCNNTEY